MAIRRLVLHKDLVHVWYGDVYDDSHGGAQGSIWEGWFICRIADGHVALTREQLEAKFIFVPDSEPVTCLQCLALKT